MYLDATTCVSFYGLEVAHQKGYQISTHLNGFFEMIRVQIFSNFNLEKGESTSFYITMVRFMLYLSRGN